MATLPERVLKLRPKNSKNLVPKSQANQLQEQAKAEARPSGSYSPPEQPAKRKRVEDPEHVVLLIETRVSGRLLCCPSVISTEVSLAGKIP